MSDESLFREVDEEVRQEQFLKIWKRYGNLIIAASVAVIVAVAAFQGWKYWQARQAAAAGAAYFDALQLGDSGKPEDQAKALAAISHAGYSQLAGLREAAALAAAGKKAEAVAGFDALAAAPGTDPAIRDLAKIRAAYILADTLKPAELAARLSGLEAQAGPWRNPAREILALGAYRSGDPAAAERYAKEIVADPAAGQGLQQRARILLELLAPRLGKPAAT